MSLKRPAPMGDLRVRPRRRTRTSIKKSAQASLDAGHHPHDEILIEELNAVHGELGRVDSKSSMLLGFAAGGLLLATTAQPIGLGGWFLRAGMGLALVSIVPLLTVVRPRLGSGGFAHHARRTVAEVQAELAKADPRTWRSEQLIALSRIAVRKFKMLRLAAGLQIVALVLAGAGTLLVMV